MFRVIACKLLMLLYLSLPTMGDAQTPVDNRVTAATPSAGTGIPPERSSRNAMPTDAAPISSSVPVPAAGNTGVQTSLPANTPFPSQQVGAASVIGNPIAGTAPEPRATIQSAAADMVIGNGDLLEISLADAPDYKADVRVSSSGEASFPLLGPVHVGGFTAEQAEKLIATDLRNRHLFSDPKVMLSIKEYTTEGITVLGEVQKPGIYPLLGSRKLFDVISAAGGVTPKAGKEVTVIRRNDPEHVTTVTLSNNATDSNRDNIEIMPGDTVKVAKAGIVYVVGDVHVPGGFVMDSSQLTVLQAIALAQGPNRTASLDGARIIRRTPAGAQQTRISLKKILAAKAPDMPLESEDIVFVPNSTGKTVAGRGLESALQMAVNIAIYHPF